MELTKQQEAEVIRVCGKNFEPSDVPAFWRDEEKEFNSEMNLIDELDRMAEEYEDTRFAERADEDARNELEN